MHIIKEQQTEVINTKCYHDNLHACKDMNHDQPEFIFLRYLQEPHLLGSSSIQSMYFRQKDAHF